MAITPQMIKDLRELTGAPMGDCKKALQETDGAQDKAVEYLQKKSLATAQKKSGRTAAEGRVGSYVHHDGKLAVLVEVNCETDFVANTADFEEIVKSVAMQIAAMNPKYVRREEIPAAELAHQREIFEAQVREMGKPEALVPRIAEGKLTAWFQDICLLDQAYVKDEKGTAVGKWLAERVAKTGENIQVRRFVRFELGEGLAKRADDFVAEVARMAAQA
ncbi:MAG: translation elongation factor Ts [Myxococcales bacterium]|nr:translation elongation factor Ts [Myxococcales bacterium]